MAVLQQDGISPLSSGPRPHGADEHTRLTDRHRPLCFCLCLGCACRHYLRSSSRAAQHAVAGLQAPFSPPCQLELGDCHGVVRAARRLKGSRKHDAVCSTLLAQCRCPLSSKVQGRH